MPDLVLKFQLQVIAMSKQTSIFEMVVATAMIMSLVIYYVTAYPRLFPEIQRIRNPAAVTDLKTITSPSGVKLRYKEPGKACVCEMTPGVNSYSGYIDLAEDLHTFFWFFEARNNASTAPITLWRTYFVIWLMGADFFFEADNFQKSMAALERIP